MTKEDTKLFTLKKAFIEGKQLSNKDICDLIDIKRSRVYDYINLLKKEGLEFTIEKSGRTVYYTLASSVFEEALYQPASPKAVLRARILYELQFNNTSLGFNAHDLCKRLNVENETEESTKRFSTYYKEIKEMVNEGILKTQKIYFHNPGKSEKTCLYVSNQDFSLMLSINKESENIIMGKVARNQNHAYALRNLQKKIAIITGDNESGDFDDSIFLQYGRGYHVDSLLSQYYQTLEKNHFQTNVLEFDYGDKHIRFDTGLVVYSQDKDMLYLIGRALGYKSLNGNPIKFTEIRNLTYTDIPNKEYGQEKYEEMLEYMFSISNAKKTNPETVEVHFTDTPLNRQRISRLCRLRVHANYNEENGLIIYKDLMSGLPDFANYLRRFTGDFKVIAPVSLIKLINDGRKRSLEHYSQQGE